MTRIIRVKEHTRDGVVVEAHERRIEPEKERSKALTAAATLAGLGLIGLGGSRAVRALRATGVQGGVVRNASTWDDVPAFLKKEWDLPTLRKWDPSTPGHAVLHPKLYKQWEGKNAAETLANVESRIRRFGVEHLFVIDDLTGKILLGTRGTHSAAPVVIPVKSTPGRYTATHNHPVHTPVSGADVHTQIGSGFGRMRAVEPDGRVTQTTFQFDKLGSDQTRYEHMYNRFGQTVEPKHVDYILDNVEPRNPSAIDAWFEGNGDQVAGLLNNDSTYRTMAVRSYQTFAKEWSEFFSFEDLGRIIKSGVSDVTKASAYAAGMDDLTIEGEIAKVDDDKRQVFGWASVTELNGQPVVDLQNDYLETVELEKAAYDYVLNSRVGGDMHKRVKKDAPKQIGTLIESMVLTPEKIEKMGLPDSTPHGWWIGFQVQDEDVWQSVKKGNYTGFSIHGLGRRLEKSLDEIGKSVLNRSPEEIAGWIQRVSAEIGVDPQELAQALDQFADQQGGDVTDDQLHDFLMETFGSGQMMAKHLLGRHEQKDHDPTKGKGHARDQHKELRQVRNETWTRANTRSMEIEDEALKSVEQRFPDLWKKVNGRRAASLETMREFDNALLSATVEILDKDPSYANKVKEHLDAREAYNPRGEKRRDKRERSWMLQAGQIAEERRLKKNLRIEQVLLSKAAEKSSSVEEFAANIEEIAKAVEPHDAIAAGYFYEVHKHLIGRHEQKDHDPTKKKRGDHKRKDHGTKKDPLGMPSRDRKGWGAASAAWGAAAVSPWTLGGLPMRAAALGISGLSGAMAARGTSLVDNSPSRKNVERMRQREIERNKRRRERELGVQKQLTQRQIEVLEKYLGEDNK